MLFPNDGSGFPYRHTGTELDPATSPECFKYSDLPHGRAAAGFSACIRHLGCGMVCAMKKTRLAFIGAGNMARSLVGGLVADGWDPACISVSDPDPEQLAAIGTLFGTTRANNNTAAVENSEIVVLAVKPQVMREVAHELAAAVEAHQPLVISIAAGIRASDLQRWLGGNCALVRCMPNTPALVQSGATAMFANSVVNDDQKALAENILRAVGLALWVDDETQMDAVTALSGSGPAYFFLVIEALQEAAQTLGLDTKTARLLAMQTAFGAAKMALERALFLTW